MIRGAEMAGADLDSLMRNALTFILDGAKVDEATAPCSQRMLAAAIRREAELLLKTP